MSFTGDTVWSEDELPVRVPEMSTAHILARTLGLDGMKMVPDTQPVISPNPMKPTPMDIQKLTTALGNSNSGNSNEPDVEMRVIKVLLWVLLMVVVVYLAYSVHTLQGEMKDLLEELKKAGPQ